MHLKLLDPSRLVSCFPSFLLVSLVYQVSYHRQEHGKQICCTYKMLYQCTYYIPGLEFKVQQHLASIHKCCALQSTAKFSPLSSSLDESSCLDSLVTESEDLLRFADLAALSSNLFFFNISTFSLKNLQKQRKIWRQVQHRRQNRTNEEKIIQV